MSCALTFLVVVNWNVAQFHPLGIDKADIDDSAIIVLFDEYRILP
jgi:hypothetical protein